MANYAWGLLHAFVNIFILPKLHLGTGKADLNGNVSDLDVVGSNL
jgi:hypothetical protein